MSGNLLDTLKLGLDNTKELRYLYELAGVIVYLSTVALVSIGESLSIQNVTFLNPPETAEVLTLSKL